MSEFPAEVYRKLTLTTPAILIPRPKPSIVTAQ
jgi:hypothetical protein